MRLGAVQGQTLRFKLEPDAGWDTNLGCWEFDGRRHVVETDVGDLRRGPVLTSAETDFTVPADAVRVNVFALGRPVGWSKHPIACAHDPLGQLET
jgi:hypothetical protein